MDEPAAFEFGAFRLLAARRELLAHGVPVTLGQRTFDVLLALVRRQGRLVTKDDLFEEVWAGVVVEENNLQVHVSALRKLFKAAGGDERFIVTVAGRGYRFVAPVAATGAEAAGVNGSGGSAGPARASASSGSTNLPPPISAIVGRADEMSAVTERLAAHRLVTLTGAGGVGKTRLAIEVGHAVRSGFPDGVWLAELAPVSDSALVLSAVAAALPTGTVGAARSAKDLAVALRNGRLLLILDNCEHVIGEASDIAAMLTRHCPGVVILATSREPLGVAGEVVFPVRPLSTPPADEPLSMAAAVEFPAARLFVERADALGIRLDLTNENAALVGAVCRRLDGVPLAIELAAPRLKVLSLAQLASGLDERLALLTGGPRTSEPRQRTLRALIDWSYERLDESEQLFLHRFAVFAGRATLPSVAAVIADDRIAAGRTLDLLASLVEKSLVVADPAGTEARYGMLESTRLYARERLTDAEKLVMRRRHAQQFAARLRDASDSWETLSSHAWVAAYGADVDDVRAALEWAFGAGGDVAIGLDLAGHSHLLWTELGLMLEHRHWIDTALKRCTAATTPELVARILSWQAGEVKDIDDPGDYDEALRAAAVYRRLGDRFSEGRMLLRAGTARLLPDDVANSERILRDARELLSPRGKTKSLARCLSALANARLFAGDAAGASDLHSRAIGIYRDVGELLPD